MRLHWQQTGTKPITRIMCYFLSCLHRWGPSLALTMSVFASFVGVQRLLMTSTVATWQDTVGILYFQFGFGFCKYWKVLTEEPQKNYWNHKSITKICVKAQKNNFIRRVVVWIWEKVKIKHLYSWCKCCIRNLYQSICTLLSNQKYYWKNNLHILFHCFILPTAKHWLVFLRCVHLDFLLIWQHLEYEIKILPVCI